MLIFHYVQRPGHYQMTLAWLEAMYTGPRKKAHFPFSLRTVLVSVILVPLNDLNDLQLTCFGVDGKDIPYSE